MQQSQSTMENLFHSISRFTDCTGYFQMIVAVEKLLSERFEGDVRLGPAEDIRSSDRSKVCRVPILNAPQDAPRSVIVKQAVAMRGEVYDPDLPGGPAERLFNEWAG